MATLYNLEPGKLFTVPKADRVTTCRLCHLPAVPYEDQPDIDLGDLYQYGKPIVDEEGRSDIEVYCAHYFCLLFSPALQTNGEDEEGIRGFLPEDILKEWRRGSRLKCCYCDKKYATLGCSIGKHCRKVYHLPCGLRNGVHVEFCDAFSTFCIDHRPIQSVYTKAGSSDLETRARECGVCLDSLPTVADQTEDERRLTLYSPCCGGWFHKTCAQRAAVTSGYFFKCPLCNNKEIFEQEMKKFGVYVPEQDAAWELEGDQFDDQYERHDRCDAEECVCPEGRLKDEDYTIWEILLCRLCGSQGCHVQCANLELRHDVKWRCPGCVETVKKLPPTVTHKFRRMNVASSGQSKSKRHKAMSAAIEKTMIRVNASNGDLTFSLPIKKFTASIIVQEPRKYDLPNRVKLFTDTATTTAPMESTSVGVINEPKVEEHKERGVVPEVEVIDVTDSDDPEVVFNPRSKSLTSSSSSSSNLFLPEVQGLDQEDDPEVVFNPHSIPSTSPSSNIFLPEATDQGDDPEVSFNRRSKSTTPTSLTESTKTSRKRQLTASNDDSMETIIDHLVAESKVDNSGIMSKVLSSIDLGMMQRHQQVKSSLQADRKSVSPRKKLKQEDENLKCATTPQHVGKNTKKLKGKDDPRQKSILQFFVAQPTRNII